METTVAKVQDIIDGKVKCPLALEVIPNYMGVNLCCVESLSWTRQSDGQLISLSIHFIPSDE